MPPPHRNEIATAQLRQRARAKLNIGAIFLAFREISKLAVSANGARQRDAQNPARGELRRKIREAGFSTKKARP